MAGGEELESLERACEAEVARADSLQALYEVRARFLGKRGSLSSVLRGIGALEPGLRGARGAAANRTKARIEALCDARRAELEGAALRGSLAARELDVTLPAAGAPAGRLHPITAVERDMAEFFRGLGFSVEEGPEVETDWNNFGALNFPDDHPSRDTQDTFFVEGGHVLRTHTSPVQIRAMSRLTPPFRFVTLGRVFRDDFDATHYPMFHQIEGFMVGEDVTFAHLKGVLQAFARHMFGAGTELRFRAHFFPFTEPSAEMDFWFGNRWLEWGGCGMIHPQVLENCGIDATRWQGFAFGMGIDRTAMERFGVPRLQLMFEGDLRVLEQV